MFDTKAHSPVSGRVPSAAGTFKNRRATFGPKRSWPVSRRSSVSTGDGAAPLLAPVSGVGRKTT